MDQEEIEDLPTVIEKARQHLDDAEQLWKELYKI